MQRALALATFVVVPCLAVPSILHAAPGGLEGEPVKLRTEDKIDLSGVYYAAKTDRAPAVLLVHDAGADHTQLADVAAILHKEGFGVLSIDLRGHGQSKSEAVDWTKLPESERESLWQLAPRDVDAAAKWLLSRDEILSTNLSLVGYRAGCALVARHAERDENVISLTLLQPKPQDFGFDIQETLLRVSGLPTCVIDRKNEEVERMVSEANGSNENPWIKLETVASKTPSVLEDKKTAAKVGRFLEEIAMPKKGRG